MTDQIIASRYRVVRELGRGGMGVVYLVEHVRTGDQLALKLLYGQGARNEQVIERFKREARASARIKSEHIVKVVDADVAPELEGAPFLVMELLNGTDLQKQLETQGRLPPDQALMYLTQAARALDKSHQMGIVHRDLKPENLFIHHREDGTTILKILDFGISKIIGTDGQSDMTGAGMTSTGAVMGTPLYMSPEQARGRVNEIGPTTDVWAMGLISLQLLTGEIYWRANTVAELMSHILSEPFYPPAQRWNWLPPGLDAWFAHSCARDPKQRFQSVGQQIQALGVALGMNAAVAALPAAPANWAQQVAAVPSTPTGPTPVEGARTTTSAVARSRSGEARRSRAPMFIGAAVLVLGGAGVAAYELRPHGTGTAASTASAQSANAAPPPLSTVPPSVSSIAMEAPAPAMPEAGAAVVTLAPVAPVAPPQHGGGRPQPAAPPPQRPPAVPAAPAPAAPPTPPPATTSHTFNPAAP